MSYSKRTQLTNIGIDLVKALEGIPRDKEPREGLQETPERMAKAWEFWTRGYSMNAAEILKVFEDGGEKYDQMVCVKDIPIYSKC
jgi:GTP cyclohydrolase I